MDAADEARLLEEELEENPDDRQDLLMGVAKAWREAGNHDRAIELLTEAAELGVEDGDCPRVLLAEVLFEIGRDDEARAQLRALRKSWPDSPQPYDQAADLMRKRGEFAEALTWYDLAIARLDADERADSYITVSRLRVRRRLGLPPDDLDTSVDHLDRHLDEIVRKLRS
jgi:tetratricopeptide (TPR) repeat protein